jgi:hypothetical protein
MIDHTAHIHSPRSAHNHFYRLFPDHEMVPDTISPSGFCPADLGGAGRWAVYNLETRVVFIKDASAPIPLEHEAKHEYFVVAPLLENGIAVIGLWRNLRRWRICGLPWWKWCERARG